MTAEARPPLERSFCDDEWALRKIASARCGNRHKGFLENCPICMARYQHIHGLMYGVEEVPQSKAEAAEALSAERARREQVEQHVAKCGSCFSLIEETRKREAAEARATRLASALQQIQKATAARVGEGNHRLLVQIESIAKEAVSQAAAARARLSALEQENIVALEREIAQQEAYALAGPSEAWPEMTPAHHRHVATILRLIVKTFQLRAALVAASSAGDEAAQ